MYAWTRAWQEAIDAGVPLQSAPLGAKLAVLTLETTEEDTLTIPLDPEWIRSWTDTIGLILASESSGLTAVFYSKNTAYDSPALNILMDGDSTETVRYPVQNRFIVSRPPRIDETVLTVDNGTSERIHLCFDLSSFSEDITVNRARLRLAIDQDATSPLSDETFTIRAHPITDLSGEIPAYESTTYITGTASGDSLILELQSFCQSWIAGIRDNLGIILIGANEKTAITRRAFLCESARMPDLDIYYTSSAMSPDNP
ncbi:MAG TPA: hypothetical protein ENN17_11510 [bacterium]|nr:hypothetical protein [bacterium]